MELIRRDTDYAFRLAAQLAAVYDKDRPLSARVLAEDNHVSYTLACKILQKMTRAGIVESVMGPKGGFRLSRNPEQIQFGHLVTAIQGPVVVNKCLLGGFKCPQKKCPARPKMAALQNQINTYFSELTLGEFVDKDHDND